MKRIETRVDAVSMASLNAEQRAFLERATQVDHKPTDEKLAIYIDRGDGTYVFVEDASVTIKANKMLAKEAPPGLYRTGINGNLRVAQGVLAVPDDRPKWWKPFPAGLASHHEGHDLLEAAHREFSEEVVAFSLDREFQFVPERVNAALKVPSLGIELKKKQVVGELVPVAFHVNKDEKVIELVFVWDGLSSLPANHSFSYDDDWWAGGHFGAPVVVLNGEGKPVGFYSGQQGYVDMEKYTLHPLYKDPPPDYKTL